MRTLTITQIFAGLNWSVATAGSYIENTIFAGSQTPSVVSVEYTNFSSRRNLDLSEALEAFDEDVYPQLVPLNITLTEDAAETYAAYFNRTVDQLEVDFYGEWKTV